MQSSPAGRARPRALRVSALLSIAASLVLAAPVSAAPRDRDGDGLTNRAELSRWHTNPLKRDTDRDGLTDRREVKRLKTNPRKRDSDRDRLRDGVEVKRYKTSPRKWDTDGDRLSDWREIKKLKTNPRKKDTDGDGLNDRYELVRSKTNPRKKDTDGDGISDGFEVLGKSDPNDPRSKPTAALKPGAGAGPAPSPPGLPPVPACTQTVSTAAAAQTAVAAAGAGAVICVANGSFGDLSLSATKPGTVTVRAQNLGGATLSGARLAGNNLRLTGFVVNGEVRVQQNAQNMTIDRNDVTSSGLGVFLAGDNGAISNVLIGANRISGVGSATSEENDVIRLHNFRGVRIENNELRNVAEDGGHSDILQTVHGGAGLIMKANYVHDQSGTQGFFMKDGAVTNLTFEENLIVDDPSGNGYAISFYDASPNPADPYYTGYGALLRRNTIWDDTSGIAVRTGNSAVLLDRNVTTGIFKESNYTATGNVVGGNPAFVNKAGGDYRLANGAAGITWQLSAQHYGP